MTSKEKAQSAEWMMMPRNSEYERCLHIHRRDSWCDKVGCRAATEHEIREYAPKVPSDWIDHSKIATQPSAPTPAGKIQDCPEGWVACGPCDRHYDYWKNYMNPIASAPTPPRYDDVYFDAVEKLYAMASGEPAPERQEFSPCLFTGQLVGTDAQSPACTCKTCEAYRLGFQAGRASREAAFEALLMDRNAWSEKATVLDEELLKARRIHECSKCATQWTYNDITACPNCGGTESRDLGPFPK